MAIDQQYLGALYKKLVMQADAGLITRRATILESLAAKIYKKEALSLVALVYGVAIPKENIEWFLSEFQKNDPGFALDGVDHEVELLAAVSLRNEIDNNAQDIGLWSCLLLEAANFGGLHTCKGDPQLAAYARENLKTLQTENVPLKDAKYNKKIDTTGQATETIEAILNYTEQGLESQATQLNNVINYVRRLEEQMQTQWWAIAGWSESANMPYAKQSLEEATVRSAVELANITTYNVAGPIAAPALFNMVLTRDRKPAQLKKLLLKNVITSTPNEWRKSWIDLHTNNPYARLTPITLAIGLATESNDEPDWEAQFTRKLSISLATEMTPIEIATQIFRELLVLKGRE